MTIAQQNERVFTPVRDQLSSYIQNNRLFVHYQPIVNISTETIQGYEALTRFPESKPFTSPVELFEFAAQTKRLFQLEKHTRELAIERIVPFLKKDQQLWVNLTPSVIHDPEFTPGYTHSVLKRTGLNPDQVVFEITEHSAITDFKSFRHLLEHYRSQGFKVAIDDVGAGYSSLQVISELKPDYMKVDRSLISDIHHYKEKQYMLEALQQIAQKMGAGIIAEGVETEDECIQLIHMGVEKMQGYFFAKPAFPPPPLPIKLTEQLKDKRNVTLFPLKITEEMTFSELFAWIATYQGAYDYPFAIMQSTHTKAIIPLIDIIRFLGIHWRSMQTQVWPSLLDWWKKESFTQTRPLL